MTGYITFTPHQEQAIARRYAKGESVIKLAEEFGRSRQTIYNVLDRVGQPLNPPVHGTVHGWRRHKADGEAPCEDCAKAKSKDDADRYERKKKKRADARRRDQQKAAEARAAKDAEIRDRMPEIAAKMIPDDLQGQ